MRFLRSAIPICVLICSTITATTSTATDRYVPDNYATIAAAMNVSVAGDRVLVRPGVYNEYAIALRGDVTLTGSTADPAAVVISGLQANRVMRALNLTGTATVSNLTISDGNALGASYVDGSAGALLIRDCTVFLSKVRFVRNNASSSGGAVRVLSGSVVFDQCEFTDNKARMGGGAIDASYGASIVVQNSMFLRNEAAWGGAASIRNSSTATFTSATITNNRAAVYPALGGGVYTDHGAQVNASQCVFFANTALYGGAVSVDREARLTITSCTLRSNLGAYSAGGIYVKAADPVVDRSLLASNFGRAVHCSLPGRLPTMTACDLWGNTGGNWEGQITGQRQLRFNFENNPLFCSDSDVRLAANSPCAAENSSVGLVGALGVGCGEQNQPGVDTPDTSFVPSAMSVAPNPLNPATNIAFDVTATGPARVRIHDLRGAIVATLVDAVLPRGRHNVAWRGTDDGGRQVASGTYLVSVQTQTGLVTRKVTVAR